MKFMPPWFAKYFKSYFEGFNLCEICRKQPWTKIELHPIESGIRVCDECAKQEIKEESAEDILKEYIAEVESHLESAQKHWSKPLCWIGPSYKKAKAYFEGKK